MEKDQTLIGNMYYQCLSCGEKFEDLQDARWHQMKKPLHKMVHQIVIDKRWN